ELGPEEPDVFLEGHEVERLIGNRSVDTEAAGVRAAEAGEHRNALEERRLAHRRLDEGPTITRRREFLRLSRRGHGHADRSMRRAVRQDVPNELLVGEA